MLRKTKLCTGAMLALAAAMMSTSACGDDVPADMPDAAMPGIDAREGDAAMLDTEAPVVAIVFPPPRSLTETERVTVRGSASDESGVVAVRVSGVEASSDDGFATWRAEVPLVPGANTLVVESEDEHGNLDASAATVTVECWPHPIDGARGIAMDTAGNRFFVGDYLKENVVAVDVLTGARSVVADATTGDGPAISSPFSMTWDAAGERLLVMDTYRILAVDPGTGDRTLISGDGVGAGPELSSTIYSLEIDHAAGRILAIDRGNGILASVDLATGDRSIVSGGGVGSGPELLYVYGMALDRANGRALVIAGTELLAVDLATGDRTMVSSAHTGTGAGPSFNIPYSVIVDATGATAWIVGRHAIYVVDTQTGDRAVLSDNSTGTGPFFDTPIYGAWDETRDRLLIPDGVRSGVIAVDIATGDRSWATGFHIGASDFWWTEISALDVDPTLTYATVIDLSTELPPGYGFNSISRVDLATGDRVLITQRGDLDEPVGVVVDGERLLLLEEDEAGVFTVDLATGGVMLLSGDGAGLGPQLERPVAAVLDRVGGALLVIDRSLGQLFAVDPLTGDRTVLSGGGVGAGAALDSPRGIALDQEGGRVFVSSTTANAILAVDLATGDRTVISDSSAGVALGTPARMAHDATRGRLLVTRAGTGLIAVDLATGARTVISGADGPGFGPPLRPHGVRVHEAAGIAWVTDDEFQALAVIDVLTGDRVIVSR